MRREYKWNNESRNEEYRRCGGGSGEFEEYLQNILVGSLHWSGSLT